MQHGQLSTSTTSIVIKQIECHVFFHLPEMYVHVCEAKLSSTYLWCCKLDHSEIDDSENELEEQKHAPPTT